MSNADKDWYKDAIIYEVHVRAFQDSDGDGLGDFRGLTRRLDYLQDLGVTAIWLLPFYPSPLRDDGYDIADYTDVHDNYGTLRDFRDFLDEAHRRGLRVITELVLNHTSDLHPWFQLARRSPSGSPERDFYVWSDAPASGDAPTRFGDARIIFQDFERSNWAWDPVARAYYWHRFYSHQPDLNFDNPAVVEAMFGVVDFWLELGVDGLRLDAAPYLFEREGTNCENLPETHEFLARLRKHIDERFEGRMLLAEANQWPEDAAAYFGAGDACHMAFHFPLMPRMFMAIQMEDRLPIVDILAQTPPLPEGCQWATFLRNHDELTLEMVTDEERDYMNRAYAHDAQARINLGIRRRLAPLMRDNRRRIELMNSLLLSMPGTPVIYYGDEIGMGDNIYLGDRNGVRTPMQWEADRNAGFSRGNPQSLYLPVITDPEFHYASVNVAAQSENPASLLSWTKRILTLRKRHRAFGRGEIEFIAHDNEKVLAFLRRYEGETILVVANLSRFAQPVELELSRLAGRRPVELFGHVQFPPIGEHPYPLTLGPHSFYWFAVEPAAEGTLPEPGVPVISLPGGLSRIVESGRLADLEATLRTFLDRFPGPGERQKVRYAEVRESLPIPGTASESAILLVESDRLDGQDRLFQLPVSLATGEAAEAVRRDRPEALIAEVEGPASGVLHEASEDPELLHALVALMAGRKAIPGRAGRLEAESAEALGKLKEGELQVLRPAPLPGPRSNIAVMMGDRYVLKIFRRVEEGPNPDQEINRFLTDRRHFPHVPRFEGSLLYRKPRGRTTALATLMDYVPNRGTAWTLLNEGLGETYRRASVLPDLRNLSSLAPSQPSTREAPAEVIELIGPALDRARLIGKRTAQMHAALASDPDSPEFAPVPFRSLDQRATYQALRDRARRVLRSLARRLDALLGPDRDVARGLLDRQDEILERYRSLLEIRIPATRIRIHGDYHLGQLLAAGDDFVIIDFEGESVRPLGERRLKRLPILDVVGLLNSIHYAACSALTGLDAGRPDEGASTAQREEVAPLLPWSRSWTAWVSAAFLEGYFETPAIADLFPGDPNALRLLLQNFRLDKSMESLGYEIFQRPKWAWIPLSSILRQLNDPDGASGPAGSP